MVVSRHLDLAHRPVSPDAVGTSDQSLVAQVRAGDRAAFVGIFTAHYVSLRDFAAGMAGSADLAEEVVQDVFVRLWGMRGGWTIRGTIRGYLFGAVRNRAFNARRGMQADAVRAEAWVREEWASAARPAADAQVTLEALELRAALDRAIARLPARCREVYILRWRHELSHAEIAESLAIKIKTVEAQITKALRILRRELAAYR